MAADEGMYFLVPEDFPVEQYLHPSMFEVLGIYNPNDIFRPSSSDVNNTSFEFIPNSHISSSVSVPQNLLDGVQSSPPQITQTMMANLLQQYMQSTSNKIPSIRTRPLIRLMLKTMQYRIMMSRNIVPNWSSFVNNEARSYPSWIHKDVKPNIGQMKTYTCFGLVMEIFVRRTIAQCVSVDWGSSDPEFVRDLSAPWSSVGYNVFNMLVEGQLNRCSRVSEANFIGPWWDEIAIFVKQTFSTCTNIQYNVELSHETETGIWTGHPDIMSEHWVLDVKCATNFKTHTPEAWLQILSYVTLARLQGKNITHTGIVLPMQHKIICIDVTNWNHLPLAEFAFKVLAAQTSTPAQQMQKIVDSPKIQLARHGVGYTISKCCQVKAKSLPLDQALTQAVQTYGSELPLQMFFRSQRCRKIEKIIDSSVMIATRDLIFNLGLKVYIHGPYNVNPGVVMDSENEWQVQKIQRELSLACQLGCKGVVVHVGKSNHYDPQTAFQNQINFIAACLPYASVDCPLMIETPVGAKNDLCGTIDMMAALYVVFCNDKRFGICLDTCHVWGANYDPAEFIKHWLSFYQSHSIRLVHFNDAVLPRGTHKDGHASIGSGKIPIDSLIAVNQVCTKNGIDMVFE